MLNTNEQTSQPFSALPDSLPHSMRVVPACGGVLSFVALILLAVGMATDHWIDFQLQSSTIMNPTIVNDQLAQGAVARSNGELRNSFDVTTNIEYNVKHYGLWIGCFVEKSNSTRSCTYIGSKCYTDVCWVRKTSNTRASTCKDTRMAPVKNCTAYQFTRAFICLSIIFMVFGTSLQIVSLLTYNRSLAAVAGVVVVMAGVFAMMGFSIFYGEEYAQDGIRDGKFCFLSIATRMLKEMNCFFSARTFLFSALTFSLHV